MGGLALVGLGFPWCVVSWFFLERPFVGGLVWGLGLPCNSVLVLAILHGYGLLGNEMVPWELAFLGWSAGMGFLLVCAWLEQAALSQSGGGDGKLCAVLLRPFGVELRVKSIGLGTFLWVLPLVSTLFGLAAYFIASWLQEPQPLLFCSDVSLPAERAAELCAAERGYMKAILDHRNHCCQIHDNTFDFAGFLSSVGGNVVTGYGIVKVFGSVGVATATDVELMHAPALPVAMASSTSIPVERGGDDSFAPEEQVVYRQQP